MSKVPLQPCPVFADSEVGCVPPGTRSNPFVKTFVDDPAGFATVVS